MPNWKSSKVITKLGRPVLTYKQVPYEAALIFNAGVVKYKGKYVMVFRNDVGSFEDKKLSFGETNLGVAYSDDGINWQVAPKPWFAMRDEEICRAYDPRLTVIDGELYMCMAVDTKHGLRGGVAKIVNFDTPPQIICLSTPDNRNMALFPEKINGNYVRLERPMPVYSRGCDRFDMWISESPDLVYWGKSRLVLAVEDVPFANDKVGPGAPPIKTDKGWLVAFHAVELDKTRGKYGWEKAWQKMYYAGIALLDLQDPSKVIGYSKQPLIVADQEFEQKDGFRQDVIFPGAMILEEDNTVKIYYGASDTVECVAVAKLDELINLCLE